MPEPLENKHFCVIGGSWNDWRFLTKGPSLRPSGELCLIVSKNQVLHSLAKKVAEGCLNMPWHDRDFLVTESKDTAFDDDGRIFYVGDDANVGIFIGYDVPRERQERMLNEITNEFFTKILPWMDAREMS